MKLQFARRTDYAIRAALELAIADRQLTADQIARASGAPTGVVAQALADLARGGIVHGVVGRTGGYRLARPAEAISVLELVDAVEPPERRPPSCVLRSGACSHGPGSCPVHPTVAAARAAFRERLGADTLAQLASRATAA